MITTDRDARATIAHAIEATGIVTDAATEYELEAILAETHTFTMPAGYTQTATEEEFWKSVELHEKTPA